MNEERMATLPLESGNHSEKIEEQSDVKSASLSDPESVPIEDESFEVDPMAIPAYMITNKWQRWANKIEGSSGAEARGIERVDDALRKGRNTARDYLKMTEIWFSVNLTVGPARLPGCIDRSMKHGANFEVIGKHTDDRSSRSCCIWAGLRRCHGVSSRF